MDGTNLENILSTVMLKECLSYFKNPIADAMLFSSKGLLKESLIFVPPLDLGIITNQ